jgi:hypothetical protein
MIEEPYPMSGGDHRMGGAVADRGIGSIAIDGGDILSSSMSDGGYSGVIHFSGSIMRRDMQTKETRGVTKTAPCFWTIDMATLPRSYLLAIGRSDFTAQETPDAWQKAIVEENPAAWVRVYGPKFGTVFSTAMRGVVPSALVPLSATRFLLVGTSRGTLNEFRMGGTPPIHGRRWMSPTPARRSPRTPCSTSPWARATGTS